MLSDKTMTKKSAVFVYSDPSYNRAYNFFEPQVTW